MRFPLSFVAISIALSAPAFASDLFATRKRYRASVDRAGDLFFGYIKNERFAGFSNRTSDDTRIGLLLDAIGIGLAIMYESCGRNWCRDCSGGEAHQSEN